jgi:DNA-binding PadR family transcriptional regulator
MTSMFKTMNKPPKRSPIALAALAMLYEAPMHPYRMQRLIKERGKDEVINVTQRASLYQTIGRLEREGLIARQPVTRDENRPERTVYEITAAGRATALEWMRQVLSSPAREFPEFPAAISFLALLTPADALQQLELRIPGIEAEIARIDDALKQAVVVPRLFLLEMEYLRASQVTELSWVRSVVEDLRCERLTWSEAWLQRVGAQLAAVGAAGITLDE